MFVLPSIYSSIDLLQMTEKSLPIIYYTKWVKTFWTYRSCCDRKRGLMQKVILFNQKLKERNAIIDIFFY